MRYVFFILLRNCSEKNPLMRCQIVYLFVFFLLFLFWIERDAWLFVSNFNLYSEYYFHSKFSLKWWCYSWFMPYTRLLDITCFRNYYLVDRKGLNQCQSKCEENQFWFGISITHTNRLTCKIFEFQTKSISNTFFLRFVDFQSKFSFSLHFFYSAWAERKKERLHMFIEMKYFEREKNLNINSLQSGGFDIPKAISSVLIALTNKTKTLFLYCNIDL